MGNPTVAVVCGHPGRLCCQPLPPGPNHRAAEALATVDAFRPGWCSADCRPLHCSRGTSVRLQLLSFALAVIHRGRTSLAAHPCDLEARSQQDVRELGPII